MIEEEQLNAPFPHLMISIQDLCADIPLVPIKHTTQKISTPLKEFLIESFENDTFCFEYTLHCRFITRSSATNLEGHRY